jgi:carbonic anhydrase
MLEPTMVGSPWGRVMARSASLLQLGDLERHAGDRGVLAVIEYAMRFEGVRTVVVCGEGDRSPNTRATSFQDRVSAVERSVASLLVHSPDIALTIEAIWLDRSSGRLLALSPDTGHYVPIDLATWSPLLGPLTS